MTKSEPLVSIVLPTLNCAKYVGAAVRSCLQQTHRNFELIVVDGGSSDRTVEVLMADSDPRIRLIRQHNNAGKLPGALNIGFADSRGSYLTWMQGDSILAPCAIEVMVRYLEHNSQVDLVYAPYWEIDEDDNVIGEFQAYPVSELTNFNVVGQCFLYRRRVYEAVGNYHEGAYLAEDYEYWLRVSQKCQMDALSMPLYYYRRHKEALTSQPGVVHKRWRLITRLKRQRFGWSVQRYWLEMASIDFDEAFACYRDREFARVPGLVLRGLARNPLWLRNRGVISILLRSLVRYPLAGVKASGDR